MEKDKKDLKKIIILILVALGGYWIINNLSTIGSLFSNLFSVLFPFILGACLAFILNIPMTFFERKLLKKTRKKESGKGTRILSIIFAIMVILLVVILVVRLIVPELMEVFSLLIDKIPYYLEESTKFAEKYIENPDDIINIIQESNIDIEGIKNQLKNIIPSMVTSSISVVRSIIGGVSTFIVSIIFAIYMLMDKEKLQRQATKILYAYTKKEKADKIIGVAKLSNNTFKKFFTVQCLEATILGTLCIVGMLILRIPYAVPVSVLVGVTALIPVVGAFIGIIVGVFLILAVKPIKALVFLIFVLILQQVEGNLIYPKVVGNTIGLPSMWVLFAVTVGGSVGGVLGMLIGVPVATILYTILKENVDKRCR